MPVDGAGEAFPLVCLGKPGDGPETAVQHDIVHIVSKAGRKADDRVHVGPQDAPDKGCRVTLRRRLGRFLSPRPHEARLPDQDDRRDTGSMEVAPPLCRNRFSATTASGRAVGRMRPVLDAFDRHQPGAWRLLKAFAARQQDDAPASAHGRAPLAGGGWSSSRLRCDRTRGEQHPPVRSPRSASGWMIT